MSRYIMYLDSRDRSDFGICAVSLFGFMRIDGTWSWNRQGATYFATVESLLMSVQNLSNWNFESYPSSMTTDQIDWALMLEVARRKELNIYYQETEL